MINIFLKEQKKKLSQYEKVSHDIYVSKFEGLTLNDYIKTMAFVCEEQHKRPCSNNCLEMLKVAQFISENGYIPLKDGFKLCSPDVTYTVQHARRKLLRIPLAAVGVGTLLNGTYCLYLVEKGKLDYSLFQSFATKALES